MIIQILQLIMEKLFIMKLTNDQENALRTFEQFIDDPEEKYMIIQGDSGTGKSTLIKMIMHYIRSTEKMYQLLLQEETAKWQISLTATTNKAAHVLSEMLKEEVCTIHSFLHLQVRPDFTTGETILTPSKTYALIHDSLIIIDEASFIDNKLFAYIHDTTINCKIILIGDQYQLAPVKQIVPVMHDLQCKYYANLTEIMRNKGPISELGVQFKNSVKTSIFTPIECNTPIIIHVDGNTFKQLINDAFLSPYYKPSTAKILAWTNDRVLEYNAHIRQIKKYDAEFSVDECVVTNKPILTKGAFHPVDTHIIITHIGQSHIKFDVPVITIQINGNENTNYLLPTDRQAYKTAIKKFAKLKDWPNYFAIKDNWLDLRSVYASTVYKSQGSEYEVVFLDLSDISTCHIPTNVARMLYVAITRATKKVVLYGKLAEKYGG